jgi:hypothetical protein
MATKTRRRNGKRRGGFTLPIAVIAGFMPGAWRLWEKRGGGLNLVANEAGRIYIGYDSWTGAWGFDSLKFGTLPIILGMAVHKVIGGMLGVNRLIARSGLPVIRL